MELTLRPLEGLEIDGRPVLRLGQVAQPQLAALSTFGRVEPFSRTPGAIGWSVQLHPHPNAQTLLFASADEDGSLVAIEVGRPWGTDAGSLLVLVDGIDVFADSADAVIAAMTAAGAVLTSAEAGHSSTDVARSIGLWRDGEPSGDDGLPRYFGAVLVGGPDYYPGPEGGADR